MTLTSRKQKAKPAAGLQVHTGSLLADGREAHLLCQQRAGAGPSHSRLSDSGCLQAAAYMLSQVPGLGGAFGLCCLQATSAYRWGMQNRHVSSPMPDRQLHVNTGAA